MSLFNGLSAFPITPANEAGMVDTNALKGLLERLVHARVQSIGLLGSTGTYAFLSRSERKRAVEAAVTQVAGRTPLIVGVAALRTSEAIRLAKDAKETGADALLMAPMSYTPLMDEEVYQHYLAVAAATDLPLCIYNNPGTTNFKFSYKLIERLAKIETIQAIKMPLPADGDFKLELATLRENVPRDFSIGYSGDWGCPRAMLAGADSWYSVVAGILPEATLNLADIAASGNEKKIAEIEAIFKPLWVLFQEFGSLRVTYTIANLLLLTDAKPPLPILPLGKTEQDHIAAALEAFNVL
ncbi:dihydrodipicolinate synthase family protein [Lentilitoribacter sp. Alg239-R112]|uniref:dihydrodipicolinate synthase family protein n=1 Tax=Lentilitoribacter sp. Alg239-R112 TaxID=2305987 RepID=UPI001575F146|nr:dihydrodipicolinate synthase family protein [Lentilitoribacter sp. Alg239-R112]